MKTKFKIGDKVRILPSAVESNISADEVGKTGVIIMECSAYFMVLMDKPRIVNGYEVSGCRVDWCVEPTQMEPVIKIGEQLLLWQDV